jgi:hypothetical protein
LNGINGNENWREDEYQDQDFEAVIDLQEVQDISSYRLTFTRFSLSDFDASIFQFILVDNINYKIVDFLFCILLIQKMTQHVLPFAINQKVSKVEIRKSVC